MKLRYNNRTGCAFVCTKLKSNIKIIITLKREIGASTVGPFKYFYSDKDFLAIKNKGYLNILFYNENLINIINSHYGNNSFKKNKYYLFKKVLDDYYCIDIYLKIGGLTYCPALKNNKIKRNLFVWATYADIPTKK